MKSIKIPFSFIGGKVNATTDESSIANQKIESVLTTSRGERILNQTFGSDIKKLVNEIPTDSILADAKIESMYDLKSQVSGVQIIDMNFDLDSLTSDDPTLNVYVTYKLPLGTFKTGRVKLAVPGIITEDTIV
jgi:hypothetical protein